MTSKRPICVANAARAAFASRVGRASLLALVLGLILSGCTTPDGTPATPVTGDVNQVPEILQPFRECGGRFLDGTPVNCSQAVRSVEVEAAVPQNWVCVGRMETNFERLRFYREPAVGSPGEWGVQFDIAPRTEGDFKSPFPTQYGGILRVRDGPVFTWQSEAHAGFVRAPGKVPGNFLLADETTDVIVYIPVAEGNLTGLENAQTRPLWIVAPEGPFRVVHQVESGSGTYFVHEAPGIATLGYSLRLTSGAEVEILHVYQLIALSDWRSSSDGCDLASGL